MLLLGQILEIEILIDLLDLRVPEFENCILQLIEACADLIKITKKCIKEVLKLVFYGHVSYRINLKLLMKIELIVYA